jgi:hypothetical protein
MLLLASFWIGADWIGAKKYQDGFEAGKVDERSRDEEKMKTLTARLQAEGLALQQKESARVREIQRIQQAASDAARLVYAEAADTAASDLARVLARLRVAEARDPLRGTDSRNRMPAAPDKAARAEAAASTGTLSAGDGERLIRLAADADKLAAQYQLCYAAVSPP